VARAEHNNVVKAFPAYQRRITDALECLKSAIKLFGKDWHYSNRVFADNERCLDHENRKTPISKPAANDQRPNVQAEITRTRLRRSWSCGSSWDRSVIATRPLRWPLAGYGRIGNLCNAVSLLLTGAQKKARSRSCQPGGRGSSRCPDFPRNSPGFEPGLCRPRAPPPGNGISSPETKAPKRPPATYPGMIVAAHLTGKWTAR
jgi:hypothetical protein